MRAFAFPRLAISLLVTVLIVSACAPEPTAPAGPPRNSVQAQKDLDAYHELVRVESYAIAVTMGNEILRKHPGSPAAAEVQTTIADIKAKAEARADSVRLKALWSYQVGPASSGTQSTASIYSTQPGSEAERVRLILRRHDEWGFSVYLFAGGKGFDCPAPCQLDMTFDDQAPQRWPAHLPETGEPAIFIDRDGEFVERLKTTRRLTVDAKLKGRGATRIVFDTGGYDDKSFLPLPKK